MELDRLIEAVYINDVIMREIVGNVESFKDRNSLELVSKRLRAVCLKTPITRQQKYKIHLMQYLDVGPRRGIHSRPWMKFTVHDCSEKENLLVRYYCRRTFKTEADIFFAGVRKRLLKKVCEFELSDRLIDELTLEHIRQFPNLKQFIFRNSSYFFPSFTIPSQEVLVGSTSLDNRIESLTIAMERHICFAEEIRQITSLIGPRLKHFRCIVPGLSPPYSCLMAQIMELMIRDGVRLDTCQLVFRVGQIDEGPVFDFTDFMVARSEVMHVSLWKEEGAVLTNHSKIKPTLNIHIRNDSDVFLKHLIDRSTALFLKAEVIRVTNMNDENLSRLADVLPKCHSLKELHITDTLQQHVEPMERLLSSLPSTLRSLSLIECKLSPSCIDLIVLRLSGSLEKLLIVRNHSCNTVQNFGRLLSGLPELKSLEIDMLIPRPLFKAIVAHPKLEEFTGNWDKRTSDKHFRIFESRFDKAEVVKTKVRGPQLVLKNFRKH
ncbi:unnamed protein product [Caenorhabditis sp. 36 PRJEB53466]|nr:unnamed protein product [Caenorhabditis sp. 36 PRJEB53466]